MLPASAHTHAPLLSVHIFLISQTLVYTQMPNREKAHWGGKAFVSRWKASHPLATCRASSDTFPRQRILKQRLCRHSLASIHTHTHQHRNTHASSLPVPFFSSLALCQWSSDATVAFRRDPERQHCLSNPEEDKLPWKPEAALFFPHRCFSTVSSQAWNMLITTRRMWKTPLTIMLDNYFPFTRWLRIKIACHCNGRACNRYAHQIFYRAPSLIFITFLKASCNHRLL